MPTPQTVKVYLAVIRYMQVTFGLPEPKVHSLMARLRLVQSSIQRSYSQKDKDQDYIITNHSKHPV